MDKQDYLIGMVTYKNTFNTKFGPCSHLIVSVNKTTNSKLSGHVKVVAWRSLSQKVETSILKKQYVLVCFKKHSSETYKGRTMMKVKAEEVIKTTRKELQILSINKDGLYDPFSLEV